MNIEPEIAYLNGFLKSLEIVGGRQARIAANWFPSCGDVTGELTAFLHQRDVVFERLDVSLISREKFLAEVWELSIEFMDSMSESVRNDLKWQFEECLGVISTSMGESQPFNPLFECPLHRVHVDGPESSAAFLIEFKGLVVALFCEQRQQA